MLDTCLHSGVAVRPPRPAPPRTCSRPVARFEHLGLASRLRTSTRLEDGLITPSRSGLREHPSRGRREAVRFAGGRPARGTSSAPSTAPRLVPGARPGGGVGWLDVPLRGRSAPQTRRSCRRSARAEAGTSSMPAVAAALPAAHRGRNRPHRRSPPSTSPRRTSRLSSTASPAGAGAPRLDPGRQRADLPLADGGLDAVSVRGTRRNT